MTDELHQELKSHAGALRGLARDLLRDSHAADDVTQQTLTKAWTSRRQLRPGPLGGWLSRTLTNFTRQWKRSERRRNAQEQEHARRHGEDVPSTDESLARRETLRTVTAAVLSLDEPYQTAIFLRYFEDLPPREIARRTDTAITTVKSRLARGLAMLRCKLATSDPSQRDWRPALAAAFGIPLTTALLPVATGVLLMKTSMKVAFAAAALCIGGLILYGTDDDPAPELPQHTEEVGSALATAARTDAQGAEEAVVRTKPKSKTVIEPWLTHPYVLELELTIVDPFGLPIEGFTPRLSPSSGHLVNISESTDAYGKVLVRVPARTPRARVEILDERRHRRSIELNHDQRTRLTLVREGQNSSVRLLSGTFVVYAADNNSIVSGVKPTAVGGESAVGLHPHALFHEDGIVAIEEEPEADPAALYERAVTLSQLNAQVEMLTARLDSNFATIAWSDDFVVEAEEQTGATIEGTVFGEDNKPAAEIPVVVLGTGPQPLVRSTTDKNGHFKCSGLQLGSFEVRAGGTHLGLGSTVVDVAAGINQTTVQLRRDACIRGKLVDENGKAVANAEIDWHANDGSWADRTTTDDKGSFVLANVPHAAGHVTAWTTEGGRNYPIAEHASVMPDSGELLLEVTANHGSTLSLQPSASTQLDLEKLRVRVRNLETGFSRGIGVPQITVEEVDAEGNKQKSSVDAPETPWTIKHLPAGNYEVEIWLPGAGRLHCGRHYVDGKTDCVLGNIMLREPGRVHFDLPEGWQQPNGFAAEISELRNEFDVRIDKLASVSRDLLLAPGNYALGIRHEDGTVRFARFTVQSGKTTNVPLGWE